APGAASGSSAGSALIADQPSNLDEERVALPAAGADCGEAEAAAVAAQLVDHRPQDPSSGRADRVPQCDGAAVHVDLLGIDLEQLRRIQDDGREGLVQLDTLDVADGLAGLLESDLPRLGRRARKVG